MLPVKAVTLKHGAGSCIGRRRRGRLYVIEYINCKVKVRLRVRRLVVAAFGEIDRGRCVTVFGTPHQLTAALARIGDGYGPKSRSVLARDRAWDPDAEPFGRGFLTGLEERTEIRRLLGALDVRDRRLLILWYVEGRPVTAIARALGISRVHCYRLRDRALHRMVDASAAKAS